jgi:hypothetical protein
MIFGVEGGTGLDGGGGEGLMRVGSPPHHHRGKPLFEGRIEAQRLDWRLKMM